MLFEGQKQFVIPLFQRVYSWDESDWETWWDDLLEVYDSGPDNPHFIGAIDSKALPHTPEGVSKFLVIDGQQRLTTTAILLATIRDLAKKSPGDLGEKIHQLYLTNPYASGPDQHKLVPTQADRAEYYALESGPESAKKTSILRASAYFLRRLTEARVSGGPLDLQKLEQALMNGLETVSVTLDDADDEYRIFESLNAKGKSLTQADLIRNYVFMRVPLDKQEELYARVWEPLQRELGNQLEAFFRHVAIGDFGRFIKEDEVYHSWKSRLSANTPTEVLGELDRLRTLGGFYAKLIQPETEPSAIVRDGLSRLNKWGRLTVYPFLLRVYAAYDNGMISEVEFADILLVVESFFVRRMFCGVPTNELNRLFARLHAQLPPGVPWAEGVRVVLSEPGRRWPTDEEFAEAMLRYPLFTDSRPEQRRLVLDRLEEELEGKEHVDLADLTIEHIMPQVLSDEWRSSLGSDADQTHAKLLHVIGNLTLTGYNPELGNAPFAKKVEIYQTSPVALTSEVAKSPEWGATQIESRGRSLSGIACKVWPGPNSKAA